MYPAVVAEGKGVGMYSKKMLIISGLIFATLSSYTMEHKTGKTSEKVVLVGSDGKSFNVPAKIRLQSGDGKIFEVATKLLEDYSVTIKNMLEDLVDAGDTPIPLLNIDSKTLETVIDCITSINKSEMDRLHAVIRSLEVKSNLLSQFIDAITFLDIPALFEQLPAIRWLSALLVENKLDSSMFSSFTGGVNSIAISQDGKIIVGGTRNMGSLLEHHVKMWNIATGSPIILRTEKDVRHGSQVAITRDGRVAVTCTGNVPWFLWDANSGEFLKNAGEREPIIEDSLAISPDGKHIFTVGSGLFEPVKIWDTATGKCLQPLGEFHGLFAMSPDGKYVVTTGSMDHTVKIWDIEQKRYVKTLCRDENIRAIAVSQDGSFIVIASAEGTAEGTVELWDAAKGTCLKTFIAKDTVWALAISPDGKLIFTGGDTVKIWNLKGECLRTIAMGAPVNALAISPDGSFIAIGTGKGGGILHLLDPKELSLLHAPQIFLISLIYEAQSKGQKLDLSKEVADLNLNEIFDKSDNGIWDRIKKILEQYCIIPPAAPKK